MLATGDPTRYLLDPYLDWAKAQGAPVIEGECVDLFAVETRPWARLGGDVSAAFVNLSGRGDFISLIVIDVGPGGRIETGHAFDAMYFVLNGEVVADARLASGALVMPAKGARLTLRNPSRDRRARIVCANALPFAMNFFRNERFLFDAATGSRPQGKVEIVDTRAAAPEDFAPPASAMRANIIEIAPGARGDIERHGAGTHLFPLGGRGYSLVWNEGQGDVERRDWRFGMAFAPRDGWFHQHFNPGDEAARLLAISFGNRQTPIFARKVEREFARDRGRHEAGEVGGRIEAIWRSETRA